MKKLFLLAWPIALAAVSCSNEEVVSVNNDANEIKFAVVAENGTRAQNVFCNVNKPTTFHVWAAVKGKQYFENVTYTKNGDIYTAKGGEVHFWPAEAVDFYAVTEETAVKNGETAAVYEKWDGTDAKHKFTWNANSASTIQWETRSNEAPSQTDLLYAYTHKSRTEATAAGTVGINFRHALSQIVFKAVNTNPTIKVEIDQVDIVNVANSGLFTLPFGETSESTEENPKWNVTDNCVEDHTTAVNAATVGVGKWSGLSAQNVTYTTTQWTTPTVIGSDKDNPTNLTDETGSNTTDPKSHAIHKHSLLLIPQDANAWVHAPHSATGTGVAGATGAYFLVYCRIWNVSGVEGGAGADLPIWATKEGDTYKTKAVAIPVQISWKPGKKYIYTFKFGSNTTGGYDPETGVDVLIPISFDVKVDDFVEVTDTPVWMGPNE